MINKSEDAKLYPAKYLTAYFQGYFMCRMATDPDPTDEKRGMSGYTMALSGEQNLDQVIRLQVGKNYQEREEFLNRNLRPPANKMMVKSPWNHMYDISLWDALEGGVQVYSVTFDGKPWEAESLLLGARVFLGGEDYPFHGAIFEGRNNITGSGDNLVFLIDPFYLNIIKTKGKEGDLEDPALKIVARDFLNPADHKQPIWKILDPTVYSRRLPTPQEQNSPEVSEAINTFDYYGYFRARRQYLQSQIDYLNEQLEKEESLLSKDEKTNFEIKIEQFKSRLYQLEFWGDRVISKLGTKVDWSFNINGKNDNIVEGQFPGEIDKEQVWPVQFWFGGWDGDLLVGYMRGSLSMPFTPKLLVYETDLKLKHSI